MTHGSLFSGIGGFDLASQWAGFKNIWQVEIDKRCNKVLEKNFPEVKRYGDIRSVGAHNLERVDIISGGFPCQPFSVAGKRAGKEDDRFLWPQMLRIIQEIKPMWVVAENVPGLLTIENGVVFEQVLSEMVSIGYEVQPIIIPACGLNAPHRRDRIWIIAHTSSKDWRRTSSFRKEKNEKKRPDIFEQSGRLSDERIITNANNQSVFGKFSKFDDKEKRKKQKDGQTGLLYRTGWEKWPTKSGICGRNDGIPTELDIIGGIENEIINNPETKSKNDGIIREILLYVWENFRLAKTSPDEYSRGLYNIVPGVSQKCTSEKWNLGQRIEENEQLYNLWKRFYSERFSSTQNLQSELLETIRKIELRKKMEQKQRVDRIKGLGNAIVPQVAYEIYRSIRELDNA